jgi:hypothetical protein
MPQKDARIFCVRLFHSGGLENEGFNGKVKWHG